MSLLPWPVGVRGAIKLSSGEGFLENIFFKIGLPTTHFYNRATTPPKGILSILCVLNQSASRIIRGSMVQDVWRQDTETVIARLNLIQSFFALKHRLDHHAYVVRQSLISGFSSCNRSTSDNSDMSSPHDSHQSATARAISSAYCDLFNLTCQAVAIVCS